MGRVRLWEMRLSVGSSVASVPGTPSWLGFGRAWGALLRSKACAPSPPRDARAQGGSLSGKPAPRTEGQAEAGSRSERTLFSVNVTQDDKSQLAVIPSQGRDRV